MDASVYFFILSILYRIDSTTQQSPFINQTHGYPIITNQIMSQNVASDLKYIFSASQKLIISVSQDLAGS